MDNFILELAKSEGLHITEQYEDQFLVEYWQKLADAFFTLYNNL